MRPLLCFMLISTPVYASEVTLVKSDNTTIKTVHHYGKPQFEVETEEAVEPEVKDPMGDASCFDNAKKQANRRDRYTLINRCLEG